LLAHVILFQISSVSCYGFICIVHTAWKTPATEIANRRHSRDERIFSMFPSTAKDFDAGVHCKPHAVESIEVIIV
jgi:exoribonuclease R